MEHSYKISWPHFRSFWWFCVQWVRLFTTLKIWLKICQLKVTRWDKIVYCSFFNDEAGKCNVIPTEECYQDPYYKMSIAKNICSIQGSRSAFSPGGVSGWPFFIPSNLSSELIPCWPLKLTSLLAEEVKSPVWCDPLSQFRFRPNSPKIFVTFQPSTPI